VTITCVPGAKRQSYALAIGIETITLLKRTRKSSVPDKVQIR
jgi:hypothetical protein